VHGTYNYRRISKLVMFIFYKAGMVAVPMYLFLFASAASGTQFFNDAIYILYNIVFTGQFSHIAQMKLRECVMQGHCSLIRLPCCIFIVSFPALPIVFLAIFDTGGVSKESLENNPRAYLSIAHGALFNDSLFFMWMIRAAWNSLWVYGIIYASVGLMDVSGRNGQGHGLWLTSTLVYTAVVLLVTLRILLEAHSINVFIAAVVAISFVLYFPIVFFANTLQRINPNLYGVFGELFGNPKFVHNSQGTARHEQ
jgi:phospholipid-translocating ATPase